MRNVDPLLRRMKSSTRILILVVLVVVAVGAITFFNRLEKGRGELVKEIKRTRTPVHTAVLAPADLSEEVTHTGALRANRDVMLTPEVAGKVTRVARQLGDRCARGAVLVQLDQETYRIAVLDAGAARQQAQAQLAQAERDLARAKRLQQRSAVAAETVERADTAVSTAKALAGRADAAARLARRNLRKTAVRCPFDGVVAERRVEQGQAVAQQTPLARLVDDSRLKLQIKVSAADLARVRVGQRVTMSDPARPILRFTGRVSRLGVAADRVTRTFPVEVVLESDATQKARTGQVVRAAIQVAQHKQVLAVPADAVIYEDGQARVYVVRQRKAQPVKVTVGPTIGQRVLLRQGVAAGDEVIVEGHHGLKVDAPVERISGGGGKGKGKGRGKGKGKGEGKGEGEGKVGRGPGQGQGQG